MWLASQWRFGSYQYVHEYDPDYPGLITNLPEMQKNMCVSVKCDEETQWVVITYP